MSYLLAGSSLKAPNNLQEQSATQYAQQKTLDGSVGRDYFGDNKRVWTLEYTNTNKADYNIINTIYLSYLSTGNAQTWQITEANYTVSQTTVHIDLQMRKFSVGGTDYISDFTLILTEA